VRIRWVSVVDRGPALAAKEQRVSTPAQIGPIIDRLDFFSSFSANEKRRIAADDACFRSYAPGEMLIRQGSRDRSLYIVLSGTVSVAGPAGDTILAVLGAGEIFGEMALLTDSRRAANVIAREPVIVLKMDRGPFERLSVQIREKFKDQIIAKLAARLNMANRELTRCQTLAAQNGLRFPAAPAGSAGRPRPVSSPAAFLAGRELIHHIIARTRSLPSVPEVMIKVQRIVRRPGTTPAQLTKLIETDPAMGVAILKVANSAFYGFRGKVTTIQHAAALLGTRRLAELITAMSAGAVLGQAMAGYGIKAGNLWRHAVAVAAVAAEIAAEIGSDETDSAYLAGLLHDVGKIILDPYVQERHMLFAHFGATHPGRPIQDAERVILGFDHAVAAAVLCEKWNLPRAITFGIRHHHNPSSVGDHPLSHIVHLADQIAIQAGLGDAGHPAAAGMQDGIGRSTVKITPERLAVLMDHVRQYVRSLTGNISP
jgi:putative nucleotidyltransferase with HDIG domain